MQKWFQQQLPRYGVRLNNFGFLKLNLIDILSHTVEQLGFNSKYFFNYFPGGEDCKVNFTFK